MQPTKETDADGTIAYTLNGKYHREDGPAIIWVSGRQYWYLNGNRHRTDGPAFIRPDGPQGWWLDNYEYSFKDYYKKLNLTGEDILFLKLKYNTCVSA